MTTPPTLTSLIQALEDAREKVSSEEWIHDGNYVYSHEGMICELSEPRYRNLVLHHAVEIGSKDFNEAMNNGRFICLAANSLPAIVAEVKRLQEENTRLVNLHLQRAIDEAEPLPKGKYHNPALDADEIGGTPDDHS